MSDTIASQSFERETPGDKYFNAATNGSLLDLGAIVDLTNNAGQSPVDSTAASATTLGFDAVWENTRQDAGLSDGDTVGVTAGTREVGSFTEGTQGYKMQDTDGKFILTFAAVDLTQATAVTVSLDYFITGTTWESDDVITITVKTDVGEMAILDTTGSDIDRLDIEDTFQTGSITLPDAATTAQLVVTLDSNAASEALYIDNIRFEGNNGAALPPQISEFQPSAASNSPAATQTIELSGAPGTAFEGVLVAIASDTQQANPGRITSAVPVAGTFDANGLLTLELAALTSSAYTLALLDSFAGTTTTDIDPNNDGVVEDLSTFGTVLDAIGVAAIATPPTLTYGTALGGTDLVFGTVEPDLIFREGSTGALYAASAVTTGTQVIAADGTPVNLDDFVTLPTAAPTFGAVNPALIARGAEVVISEVDAAQTSPDTREFIELFDGGVGNVPLDGLVLVLYDGETDTAYRAIALDGQTTNADGLFVVGHASVAAADLPIFTPDSLHNGPAAVALYTGTASDFPVGTAVTADNLVDAIVYGTNDAPDATLLSVLTPGQPQANETATTSLQRSLDGSATLQALAPTPGILPDSTDPLTASGPGAKTSGLDAPTPSQTARTLVADNPALAPLGNTSPSVVSLGSPNTSSGGWGFDGQSSTPAFINFSESAGNSAALA